MVSARKKVIVRRFQGELLRGYLPAAGFVGRSEKHPSVDLLDLAGRVQAVSLPEVKLISFVRDFHVADEVNPERLPRRTFLARPRTEGLLVRIALQDDDVLEGLAPLDITLADNLVEDLGLHLTPPDVRGNTQRLFVPRSAMTSLQIVAVITAPSRRTPVKAAADASDAAMQLPLTLVQSTP